MEKFKESQVRKSFHLQKNISRGNNFNFLRVSLAPYHFYLQFVLKNSQSLTRAEQFWHTLVERGVVVISISRFLSVHEVLTSIHLSFPSTISVKFSIFTMNTKSFRQHLWYTVLTFRRLQKPLQRRKKFLLSTVRKFRILASINRKRETLPSGNEINKKIASLAPWLYI